MSEMEKQISTHGENLQGNYMVNAKKSKSSEKKGKNIGY